MTTSPKIIRTTLHNRAARLIRLLELDAPTRIICGEALLIFKTAAALDPKAFGELFMEYIATAARRDMGMCTHDGCGEVVERCDWETFKAEMCTEHATQAQREVDAMEEGEE